MQRAATRLDPDYVRALGQVDNAEWGRRAALRAFVLPVAHRLDRRHASTRPSSSTSAPAGTRPRRSTAHHRGPLRALQLRGSSPTSSRTGAELRGRPRRRARSSGSAPRSWSRPTTTPCSQNQELLASRASAPRRAEEGLVVARARVVVGAAVQTRLAAARAGADRRPGWDCCSRRPRCGWRGCSWAGAIGEPRAGRTPCRSTRPRARPAAGAERRDRRGAGAGPAVPGRPRQRALGGGALPRGAAPPIFRRSVLSANTTASATSSSRAARNVSSSRSTSSFPLWDNGQRELAVTRARANRDVARAIREDLERAPRRDVTEAYEAYGPRGPRPISRRRASSWPRENYRVQEARYRAGASTILDLLDAQSGSPRRRRTWCRRAMRRASPWPASRRCWAADSSRTRKPRETIRTLDVRPASLLRCSRWRAAAARPSRPASRRRPAAARARRRPCRSKWPSARTDTVVDAILATGQIEAMQSIELRPDVEGRLVEILVREGAEVAPGHAALQGG